MLDEIKALCQSKQSSKSAIALFLIEHLESIEQLSLEEIAQQSFTSKASLVRFAQALGFKGWTDFLPALIAERYYAQTHYSGLDHSLPFSDEDDLATIVQKIATIEKESIQETADKLDPADLERAAGWLQEAERVVIFGLTPNEYLAHLFKRKMLSIGKSVQVAQAGEFGLTAAALHEEDLAIIISYSSSSSSMESLRYLSLLKKQKVKILGLTSENGHLLREAADTVLTICTREDNYKKIGNFSTEESIHFLLNSLYAAYFKKDYFANYVRKINLAASLEENR